MGSMRNQWLMLVKNDDPSSLVRDLPHVLGRESIVLGYNAISAPRQTASAVRAFCGSCPRAGEPARDEDRRAARRPRSGAGSPRGTSARRRARSPPNPLGNLIHRGGTARRVWLVPPGRAPVSSTVLHVLVLAEFKLKYQDSALGYVWSIVRPLSLFTVMYLVFGRLFDLDQVSQYYGIALLTGIVLWSFFAEATARGWSRWSPANRFFGDSASRTSSSRPLRR